MHAPGITEVEICGDAGKVVDWLGEPVARAEFRIDWVDDDDPGLVAVHFSTDRGVVRIDGRPALSHPLPGAPG